MLNVAIVEDEREEAERLESFLRQYAQESEMAFHIKCFNSGLSFLDSYKSNYDLVFMDIDLPTLNGLETSRQLRKLDTEVLLIFVTNFAKFAINGYEYNATDYMLKPLKYTSFSLKLKRALRRYSGQKAREIMVRTSRQEEIKFSSDIVQYVEINAHALTYHTENGEYTAYGTMKQVVSQFSSEEFALCSSSYLVGLRHVTKIDGNLVYVGDKALPISRPKKKSFVEALHNYYGA